MLQIKQLLINSITNIIIVVTSINVIVLLLSTIKYPYVNSDAAFYLMVGKNIIREGFLYYKDIFSPYTPLGIYIYSLPYYFTSNTEFMLQIILSLSFLVINSILFYKIVLKISDSSIFSVMMAIYFLLLNLEFGGTYVYLEPIAIFFVLLSLSILSNANLKYRILIAGLFLSFAILVKQYTILFLIPFLVIVSFANQSRKIKSALIFIIGVLSPLPCLIFYLLYFNIDIIQTINLFFGKNENFSNSYAGMDYNFMGLFQRIIVFLFYTPYFVVLFFVPSLIFIVRKNKLVICHFTFLIFSLLPLYFAYYFHYFQLIIPFYILLVLSILYTLNDSKKLKSRMIFFFMTIVLISSIFLSYRTYNIIMKRESLYNEQILMSKEIDNILPSNSKVFLDGLPPYLYLTNNFSSINMMKVGYIFPEIIEPKKLVQLADKNSYFLVDAKKASFYNNLFQEYELVNILNKIYYLYHK